MATEKNNKTKKIEKKQGKGTSQKIKVEKCDNTEKVIEEATLITKNAQDSVGAAFITRLGAFIIDFFIISMIVSLLTYPFTNNSNYNKLSKEAANTIEQYSSGKIDMNTYINRSSDISYDMSKEALLTSLIGVFIFSLYYIVYQYRMNGQTIGKKLLKIKIVKDNNGDLTINDIMFRSLIVNFILYDIISLCITMFLNKNLYFYGTLIFEIIQYLVIFIIAIMILSRKDKRGLHDIITHTRVIKDTDLVGQEANV